jgi:hypothetical protein
MARRLHSWTCFAELLQPAHTNRCIEHRLDQRGSHHGENLGADRRAMCASLRALLRISRIKDQDEEETRIRYRNSDWEVQGTNRRILYI